MYLLRRALVKKNSLITTMLMILISTSCGLVEKYKTPEQPVDSKTANTTNLSGTDDLFSKSMNDNSQEIKTVADDNPTKIENEFTGIAPTDSKIVEVNPTQNQIEKPQEKQEEIPQISSDSKPQKNAVRVGQMQHYKVQKGETLMQIAFKIYGDIDMWKELKMMNKDVLAKANSALRANMELKYAQPEKEFVWNPEGTAYLIKNGDTLALISNNVYQTPRKWKKIWNNNKVLIKNPNHIYAGFTIYYKPGSMANYVEPKPAPKKIVIAPAPVNSQPSIEDIKIEQALKNIDKRKAEHDQMDSTSEVQSSTLREMNTQDVGEFNTELDVEDVLAN
jgi:nucleoid-associated protein YgaU